MSDKPAELNFRNLDAVTGGVNISEMGQMQSMSLQMAMDRQSKFATTLSNIMKKVSDTDSAIVNNLK